MSIPLLRRLYKLNFKNVNLIVPLMISFIFITFYLFVPATIYAQQNPAPTSSEREFEFLKEEYRNARESNDKEKAQYLEFVEEESERQRVYMQMITNDFYHLVKEFFAMLFIAIPVALTIASFLGYKFIMAKIAQDVSSNISAAVGSITMQTSQNIQEAARRIYQEEQNLTKRIVIIAKTENEFIHGEISKLKSKGMTNISESYNLPIAQIDLDTPAVIIFRYTADADDTTLTELVESLISRNSGNPLIVYSKGQILNTTLKNYAWSNYANSPMTLINTVFLALNSV